MKRAKIVLIASAALLASACVSKGEYNAAVASASDARAQLAKRSGEWSAERDRLEKRIAELDFGRASMQKELDDDTAVYDQLSLELGRLGADSKNLLEQNGSLTAALESSRARLDELRRAQAAADQRAAFYRDLALKLKGMIDAGDLAITLRDGRMVLRLQNDVLFDSGRAELKAAGKRTLAALSEVLRSIPGRRYQVTGHTDDEPIHYSAFRSNWELSTARSLEVVSFLVAQKVDPSRLSAAGYGEFDPVAPNDTATGRYHNRRTEITLQPNIDELVAVPLAP